MTSLPGHLQEHYEDPYNYGPLDDCSHQAELSYPKCPMQTDVCIVQAVVSRRIASELWFDGDACPWCQSAASLLLERFAGQPVDEILQIATDSPGFWKRARGNGEEPALADVARAFRETPPEHTGCVELVLRTLAAALQNDGAEDGAGDDSDGARFSGPHLGEET